MKIVYALNQNENQLISVCVLRYANSALYIYNDKIPCIHVLNLNANFFFSIK